MEKLISQIAIAAKFINEAIGVNLIEASNRVKLMQENIEGLAFMLYCQHIGLINKEGRWLNPAELITRAIQTSGINGKLSDVIAGFIPRGVPTKGGVYLVRKNEELEFIEPGRTNVPACAQTSSSEIKMGAHTTLHNLEIEAVKADPIFQDYVWWLKKLLRATYVPHEYVAGGIEVQRLPEIKLGERRTWEDIKKIQITINEFAYRHLLQRQWKLNWYRI